MNYFTVLVVTILLVSPFGCALKAPSPEDLQQLEKAKILFETQIENDKHPVIWAYLDEVLHDPYSFACSDLNTHALTIIPMRNQRGNLVLFLEKL